jgi:hypothetical protein
MGIVGQRDFLEALRLRDRWEILASKDFPDCRGYPVLSAGQWEIQGPTVPLEQARKETREILEIPGDQRRMRKSRRP